MKKPNILYLFTDQLRGDSLGYSSGGEVITPNIDELASRSLQFNRCISNSPLCVPARASLMTGMLPREIGVWSNRKGSPSSAPSHVRNIREAGYATAVIGKTHLWRVGPGPKPGMHSQVMDEVLGQWGFDYRVEVNDPIGTGTMGCAYTDHLDGIGWLQAHREYILNWISELRSGNPTPWAQEPSPVPEGEDIDSFIGRSAVNWLKSYDFDRPFYLQVQFTGPHDPYDGPYRYRELYDTDNLGAGVTELPENEPLARINARYRRPNAITKATVAQRQRWRVNYYANISLIDFWIGEILQVLLSKGMADNTWIVFTSDHGEMLGELGLIGKTVYYEPSVRVPCLLRAPNGVRRPVNDLIEQVDIPTTLLEIAGAKSFEDSTGRSLLPFLCRGKTPVHKPFVVSELFGETTVVNDRFKLTLDSRTSSPLQLIDIAEDPHERVNRVSQPEYRTTVGELCDCAIQLNARMNHRELVEYREYVETTGSLN